MNNGRHMPYSIDFTLALVWTKSVLCSAYLN